MDPRNFTHLYTYRNKFYSLTAAVSLAACTCALGLPSTAFAANQTPAASAPTSTPASTASSTPAPAPVPSSAPVVTTPHASAPASPETPAQPQDDSLTWTRDDFNISADGKTIGLTGLNKSDGYPGLNAKGVAKLKKNPHIVIPDGVEVILNNSFIGHKTDDTFIEGITLPDSLKIIEDGAFSWQKIKGTVVIPKNVIAVHPAAFLGNEIEKVVFKSTLAETGKRNSTDDHAYYLAGLGNRAFQGNKIKEIEFTGNLTSYKFHVDSKERQNPDAAPFSNQELDMITVEVGEAYKTPIKITQENASQVNAMEGFFQNRRPALIDSFTNFQKNDKGEYVAKTPGTLDGLVMLYDLMNGDNRNIASARFKYEILPKGSLCTVTFNSENAVLSKIRVRKGKSVTEGAVNGQHMPADPSKKGYAFKGWNTKSDGTGDAFSATTVVNSDWSVYAVYSKNPEPQPEPKPEPKPEPEPAPAPTPYPLPVPVPEAPAPAPAPAPVPEHKVPALETPAPKAPAAPAEAPAPVARKHVRALPQTGDPMAISAVGEFGMMAGIVVASLAATLCRKCR